MGHIWEKRNKYRVFVGKLKKIRRVEDLVVDGN